MDVNMSRFFIGFVLVCVVHCTGDASDSSRGQDDGNDSEKELCTFPGEPCSSLSNLCLTCVNYNYDTNCTYGKWMNVTCSAFSTSNKPVECSGPKESIVKHAKCVYCYQTESWEQECLPKSNCVAVQTPTPYYITNCTVLDSVMCIGNRNFSKKVRCNWTRGHKWSTALILSITLGGFGADRFYLGHWQEGIGKLFSFGGLGVWTVVDVLLIAIRYLGPADGSFYV